MLSERNLVGGSKLKIKRLQEEGVKVLDNKIVDFESILFKGY